MRRLIGGASTTATVPGECTGCHVEYSIDVRLPAPDCPDCGDPVLRQDDFDPVPVAAPAGRIQQPEDPFMNRQEQIDARNLERLAVAAEGSRMRWTS